MPNGIYKFENNINHMIYIGQAVDLDERRKKHIRNIKDLNRTEDFYVKGLRPYGIENFSYEILESFSDTDYDPDRLNKLEIYYIEKFDSYHNGYNMNPGGHGGNGIMRRIPIRQYSLQGDFIKEFSCANEAARIINGNRGNILLCCRQQRNQSDGYQWRYASENIDKLSDISLEVTQYNRPVLQYDLQGNFIKEFSSLQEASEETGTQKATLCAVCKQVPQKKTANGFQWKYKDNDKHIILNIDKSVYQIDKETNEIIKQFKTATEASKELKISRGSIGDCLSGRRKSAGGFKWIYIKDYK